MGKIDVVVVGAGVAGLASARWLDQAGYTTVVLESRQRVGGRLLSGTASGSKLDLGATWYWPSEPNVVGLIDELGLDVFAQHLAGDAMYHGPDGPQRLDGNPIDVASGRFGGGADSLTSVLADQLPTGTVHLGHAVTNIDGTGPDLAIAAAVDTSSTSDGSVLDLSARQLILAVPPALAVHRIEFLPGLDERLVGLAAATPVWMGAITKVVIEYERPFWREQGLSGSAMSHLGPMREIHDMSGVGGSPPALFGFVPATAVGEPTVERGQIIGQLRELFGPDAAEPTQVTIQDWRQEEWTSPPGVERFSAYQTYGHELFQKPALGDRLHWASTETSTASPGHIEGALVAAKRAVSAVVGRL